MTKVFIGGSRRVSHLSVEVRRGIDRIIEKRLPVVIGDATGADRAVQDYLRGRQYDQVEVFCVEGTCRNNVGNWPSRLVPAPNDKKDFSYYEAKDKVMANEASVGFMIWDGKSIGTLMNVLRLTSQHKKVVMYVTPMKEFLNLNDETDWERFLMRFGNDLRGRIEGRVANDDERSPIPAQARLFPTEGR
jgi:adenine-specific DNA-methyltransferase